MKTIGIVAEWNPFHNGHLHLVQSIRAHMPEACVVGVMSGAFCQRGEAACVDKWARTEMALAAGVDVVLELPQVYATASLEGFAQGGVATLLSFAPLDALYCGSESADEALLTAQAAYLKTHRAEYDAAIRAASDTGYAEASQRFLAEAGLGVGKEAPNDRLALHYRLALPENIPMHLVARTVSHHASESCGAMMSASAIRTHLPTDLDAVAPYLPQSSLEILKRTFAQGHTLPDHSMLFTALQVLACGLSPIDLAARLGIADGWEHRLADALHEAQDMEDLLGRAQTRHYSRSRVRRLLLSLVSPLPEAPAQPGYVRILGFSARGRALLRAPHDVPRILNTAKDAGLLSEEARTLLEADLRRQDLADRLCSRTPKHRDYLERPRLSGR